ncbi:BUD13-like protein isoform X2 [Huso huso]|uniref:BUD13 homolog n=1 Tax=Huso huso TaxID=61971 RepID=A0ABR0Y5S5_HUSHU
MAASSQVGATATLSKADYLKRYLSGDGESKKTKEKKLKKKRPKPSGKGMRIVDDDVDWKQFMQSEEKDKPDEEEEEAPVVAEVIDERPDEVKRLEEFTNSNKWKTVGDRNEDSQDSDHSHVSHLTASSGAASQKRTEDVSRRGLDLSPARKGRHNSPDLSPARKGRHNSPDLSPARKGQQDSPDLSAPRRKPASAAEKSRGRRDSPSASPTRRRRHDSSDLSPPRNSRHDSDSDLSPPRKKQSGIRDASPQRRKHKAVPSTQQRHDSDSDVSPPRQKARRSDSDLSPPRRRPQQGGRRGSDSDLSPPRRRPQQGGRRGSDSDLSPPRRNARPSSDMSPPRRGNVQGANQMLSGGTAGLVSVEVLRKEHEENRKRERQNKPLEDASRNAQTVFRDKSGKKRDIELERIEKQKAAGEKAEKDEKYAQWGKGLVQGDMQQRNVEDAVLEAQKPLARHIDDEDLDKLLREQERDGDPMAGLLRKKKEKEGQKKGVKERPKYKGPPPPPNRFNIMPGYRWDGVNRSNGFEKQRYSRMADKKAVQEVAYKWSVEDM